MKQIVHLSSERCRLNAVVQQLQAQGSSALLPAPRLHWLILPLLLDLRLSLHVALPPHPHPLHTQ